MIIEIAAHKLCVLNADTETETFYIVNIRDIFEKRRNYCSATIFLRNADRIFEKK